MIIFTRASKSKEMNSFVDGKVSVKECPEYERWPMWYCTVCRLGVITNLISIVEPAIEHTMLHQPNWKWQ